MFVLNIGQLPAYLAQIVTSHLTIKANDSLATSLFSLQSHFAEHSRIDLYVSQANHWFQQYRISERNWAAATPLFNIDKLSYVMEEQRMLKPSCLQSCKMSIFRTQNVSMWHIGTYKISFTFNKFDKKYCSLIQLRPSDQACQVAVAEKSCGRGALSQSTPKFTLWPKTTIFFYSQL